MSRLSAEMMGIMTKAQRVAELLSNRVHLNGGRINEADFKAVETQIKSEYPKPPVSDMVPQERTLYDPTTDRQAK